MAYNECVPSETNMKCLPQMRDGKSKCRSLSISTSEAVDGAVDGAVEESLSCGAGS